jgi:hypothetical protein
LLELVELLVPTLLRTAKRFCWRHRLEVRLAHRHSAWARRSQSSTKKAVALQARWASLPVAAASDQAGVFKHLQVLGDGGLGQWRALGEFQDARLARTKALEDGPPGWDPPGRRRLC